MGVSLGGRFMGSFSLHFVGLLSVHLCNRFQQVVLRLLSYIVWSKKCKKRRVIKNIICHIYFCFDVIYHLFLVQSVNIFGIKIVHILHFSSNHGFNMFDSVDKNWP